MGLQGSELQWQDKISTTGYFYFAENFVLLYYKKEVMKELRLIVFFVLAFLSVQAQNCPSSIAVTDPQRKLLPVKHFNSVLL